MLMETPELLLNLAIGIIGGVVASVLTLMGDRWLHRFSIERRLRRVAGNYIIVENSAKRDTSKERVTISHTGDRRFSVVATGGPTGNWSGFFIVREDFFEVAHGVYRYDNNSDWGQHEFLFDLTQSRIFVYGINRSRPGLIEPYSLLLERIGSGGGPPNECAAGDDGPAILAPLE